MEKQTPEQTIAFAKALIELNRPLSSFNRDTIAELLLKEQVCSSMGQARAQVKFWSKNMAKNNSKNQA